MRGSKRTQPLFMVFMAFGLLLLTGCATSAIIAKEKISEGDKAILEAKETNARLDAPIELKAAEDKLAAAKAALGEKNYSDAARLAEQASVDADYARAKGSSEKTRKKTEEIRRNINTLRQEIELLSKQITLQGGR